MTAQIELGKRRHQPNGTPVAGNQFGAASTSLKSAPALVV